MMRSPFNASPNPALLHVTPSIKAVLHKVRKTIDDRLGLTTILGDVGVGKSTVLRMLYSEYDGREDCEATLIATPNFKSEFAFLKAICSDFKVAIKKAHANQQSELENFLVEQYQGGKNVAVFVDEAQTLNGRMLEQIRALLNYEASDGKLIQIVLAGQLDLRDKLKDNSKKAIRKRIFLPSLLDPLDLDETREMLEYRCDHYSLPFPFTSESLESIHSRANGVPRDILRLCSMAFEMARLINNGSTVTIEMVDQAYREFEETTEV
jgi:general secretion pathway protein A